MDAALGALAALYLVIGVAVYAATDSRGFAARLESLLVVVPRGTVQHGVLVFAVALWPLWLAVLSLDKSRGR